MGDMVSEQADAEGVSPLVAPVSRGTRAANLLVAAIVQVFTVLAYLHGYANLEATACKHGVACAHQGDGLWAWLTGARSFPLMFDAFALSMGLQALVWLLMGRHDDYRWAWRLMLVYSVALIVATSSVSWNGWATDPLAVAANAWPGVTVMFGWDVLLRRFRPARLAGSGAPELAPPEPPPTAHEERQERDELAVVVAPPAAPPPDLLPAPPMVPALAQEERQPEGDEQRHPEPEPLRQPEPARRATRTTKRRTKTERVRELLLARGGAAAPPEAVKEIARKVGCVEQLVRQVRKELGEERPKVVNE